jgi:hypothetical protein
MTLAPHERATHSQSWHQPTKPIFLCVPSQNGFVAEPPQRHRTMSRFSRIWPPAPDTFDGPAHFRGPFGLGVITSRPAPTGWLGSQSSGSTPASRKPACLCVPSQYGLFDERPQRQSTTLASSRGAPRASSAKSPVTMYGPSGRT